VLPLLAAVLNKLQLLGVPCEVRADDAAQSLVIVVHGATVEPTPEGRRRLVMRSASASVSVKGD
jgi:Flp pilus assembly protein CpaB